MTVRNPFIKVRLINTGDTHRSIHANASFKVIIFANLNYTLSSVMPSAGPSRFLMFTDNYGFFTDILIFFYILKMDIEKINISVKNLELSVKIKNREGPASGQY